jgi:hypothetical protein
LLDLEFLKFIIQNNELYSPTKIECINKNNKLKVSKKHFGHLQPSAILLPQGESQDRQPHLRDG